MILIICNIYIVLQSVQNDSHALSCGPTVLQGCKKQEGLQCACWVMYSHCLWRKQSRRFPILAYVVSMADRIGGGGGGFLFFILVFLDCELLGGQKCLDFYFEELPVESPQGLECSIYF